LEAFKSSLFFGAELEEYRGFGKQRNAVFSFFFVIGEAGSPGLQADKKIGGGSAGQFASSLDRWISILFRVAEMDS